MDCSIDEAAILNKSLLLLAMSGWLLLRTDPAYNIWWQFRVVKRGDEGVRNWGEVGKDGEFGEVVHVEGKMVG